MERDAEFRGSQWDQPTQNSDLLWDQKLRVATVRKMLVAAIAESGEKDISILIAALTELLGTVSDWNLQAERDQARAS